MPLCTALPICCWQVDREEENAAEVAVLSLLISMKTISEGAGGPSQGWLRRRPEAKCEQAGMPRAGCKELAAGTNSYLYGFTIVMSWSVLSRLCAAAWRTGQCLLD